MNATMIQEVAGAFRAGARRLGLGQRDTARGSPTKRGFELPVLNLAELRALDLPERRRLLPWLVEGGLIMIYGPRGIGKTHFALSLAVALACGKPFLSWKVIQGPICRKSYSILSSHVVTSP